MVMTDTSSTASTSAGSRLVTVDDLRYELQRERAITDAHFMRITSHVESLDHRLAELSHDMSRRFTEARENVDHRFTSVDARFEQIDTRLDSIDAKFEQIDTRFNRLEARLDARFDALDERLRFNKTLIVASLSAAASVASVFVSLLK
jgi:chaperonin cofactor prefoldin